MGCWLVWLEGTITATTHHCVGWVLQLTSPWSLLPSPIPLGDLGELVDDEGVHSITLE